MPTPEEMARDLRSWRPSRFRAAAEGLIALGGKPAVAALIEALERPASILLYLRRAAIIRALGALGDPEALGAIARLFEPGSNPTLFRATTEALVRLLDHAEDIGPSVRLLGELYNTGSGAAVAVQPPGHRDVEQAIVRALIRAGKPLAAPVLQTLRDHYNLGMPYWAEKALRGASQMPANASSPEALAFLAEERALPTLLRSVAEAGPKARRRVIEGWAALAPEVVEPLLRLTEQNNPRTRLWAAEALGRIGGDGIAARLRDLLADADPDRRLAGAVGLAYVPDARGLARLREALGAGDPEARREAAAALGRLGGAAGSMLAPLRHAALMDDEGEVRSACEDATRRIERALRNVPAELEAAAAPGGTGTELEASDAPPGCGTEPEAGEPPSGAGDERA